MKKKTFVIIVCAAVVVSVMAGLFIPAPRTAEQGAWRYTIVVEPQYREITSIHDGVAVVATAFNRQYAVIDWTGAYIVPPGRYSWISGFVDGFARVRVGHEWSIINTRGEELIPIGEGLPGEIGGGLAVISVGWDFDAEFIIIDTTGRQIDLPRRYSDIFPSECGFIWVQYNERWNEILDEIRAGLWDNRTLTPMWETGEGLFGILDRTGTEIIPPQFNIIWPFYEGVAPVVIGNWQTGQEWGVVDLTGTMIVPFGRYSYIMPFSEGLAAVSYNGLLGFIDTTGTEVVTPQFEFSSNIWPFSEGLIAVQCSDYLWGYMDATGAIIVEPRYNLASSFSDGVAAVAVIYDNEVKWGLIDRTGTEIVPPGRYDLFHWMWDINLSRGGFIPVAVMSDRGENKFTWGFIDTTGAEIIAPQFDNFRWIFDRLAAVAQIVPGVGLPNYQWGVIDIATGEEVVPFGRFNEIGFVEDGLVAVRYGGKALWGLIRLER